MSTFFVNGPSSFAVRGRSYGPQAADPVTPAARSVRRWPLTAAVLLLLALAGWQLGAAAWIHAKAALAQHLIASAWEDTKAGGSKRPWPWADTRPVARLTVGSRGIDLYVLAGTSGRSLAFGPGHVDGTALPGSAGNSVIVAHRDTHFAFLRDLHEDDEIAIEDVRGRVTRYRVREVAIVDKHDTSLLDPADSPQLTLITCWPFDAVQPGSPQRYVVIADRAARS
ncbi:MAG: class GN sortase [Betaproteobacteria bacterium]|nr:class GN sortase [Betaproteobacteria bacterium]